LRPDFFKAGSYAAARLQCWASRRFRLPTNADDDFYNRADAVIHLANDQLAQVSRGKVSASCMYATSRFNAWVSACGFESATDMLAAKDETMEYFVGQFRAMLQENFDDYIKNFDSYMQSAKA
jgi:hypothetical protein